MICPAPAVDTWPCVQSERLEASMKLALPSEAQLQELKAQAAQAEACAREAEALKV